MTPEQKDEAIFDRIKSNLDKALEHMCDHAKTTDARLGDLVERMSGKNSVVNLYRDKTPKECLEIFSEDKELSEMFFQRTSK
jgi:hypothetical protein